MWYERVDFHVYYTLYLRDTCFLRQPIHKIIQLGPLNLSLPLEHKILLQNLNLLNHRRMQLHLAIDWFSKHYIPQIHPTPQSTINPPQYYSTYFVEFG